MGDSWLVAIAAWVAWWFVESRGSGTALYGDTSLRAGVEYAWDLVRRAFEIAALGSEVGGLVLLAAAAVYAVFTLRQGLDVSANLLAWSAAIVAWGVGIKLNRGAMAGVDTFRFQLPVVAFILLALLPRRPVVANLPALLRPVGRRALLVGAMVVLVLGGVRAVVVRDDIQASARRMGEIGRATQGHAIVLELGPGVVPDDTEFGAAMGYLTAGKYRELYDEYGVPHGTSVDRIDRDLVDLGLIAAPEQDGQPSECETVPDVLSLPTGEVVLWSPEDVWTVDIRRFGEDWVRLKEVTDHRSLVVALPPLGTDLEYEIRAPGACREIPAPDGG